VIHPVQEDHTMPAPLSLDLRRRFQLCIEEGLSGREAARRLRISAATGGRLAQKVRRGESLAPAKCGRPPGLGKIGAFRAFLVELVTQDPDITLHELRDALTEAEGVKVHHSAIGRALASLGFSYKKNHWSRTNGGAPMSPGPGPTG
jgi:transposase